MLCCTDLLSFSSDFDGQTNEDLQHSLSVNSRRLVQTSDNRTQSVYLSDHVRVDTSNQLDTDEDCKQSYSACDTEVHVESDQQRFTCEVCDQTFPKASSLKLHMRSHTKVKTYISCKFCDRKFKYTSALITHERIHTGERPFVCYVCDKKFKQSHSLKTHMGIHSGQRLRPFSCEVCNKKFLQSGNLTNHMRIHTGERPFSCKVCGKTFTDPSTLRNHMDTHKLVLISDPGTEQSPATLYLLK